MTGARIRDRIEGFRRAGARDKGFVLISTILLFSLVSGTAYWMIGTTQRSIVSATKTSEFVQSGQLADLAIQDAMYQLNEVQPKTLPTQSSPRKGGTTTEPWSWYADTLTDAAGGKRTVLHATGTYRDARREVQATVQSLQVGGFRAETDKSISYEIAPSAAFTYAVMGTSVTVRDGIGAPDPFIRGTIGVLGSTLSVRPDTGSTPEADVTYQQFGSAANAKSLTGSLRAPVGLALDPDFILSRLSTCAGTGLQDWTASANGGVLTANGNAGCYKSMNFDVPTVIQGSGAFNAYVSGNVTFGENVSASTGTGLNIYTNGNAYFPTEDASGSSLTVRNTFIYAPQGTCKTTTGNSSVYRSTLKTLKFYGSLACRTVQAAGQFRHVDPIDPDGNSVFGNIVWFLADYQQPSGTRIR